MVGARKTPTTTYWYLLNICLGGKVVIAFWYNRKPVLRTGLFIFEGGCATATNATNVANSA